MIQLNLLLEKLNRYRQKRAGGCYDAQPLRLESKIDYQSTPAGYDQAAANDLSYEDALLDLEIRSFMLSEYGHAEPPAAIFQRLLRAIQREMHAPAGQANQSRFLAELYRKLTGPIAGRIVPGAVALALVIMIMSGNATRLLRAGSGDRPVLDGAISSPTSQTVERNAISAEPTMSGGQVAGLILPIKDEAQFLDRSERRLPALRRADKNDEEKSQPELIQNDGRRYGAQ